MSRLNGILRLFKSAQLKDRYIVSHLYGQSPEPSTVFDQTELNELIKHDQQSKHSELSEEPKSSKSSFTDAEVKKLSPIETYMALIKGYCSLSILLMPKAFMHGGWLASAAFEILSGIVSTYCVSKLVQAGMKAQQSSYQGLVEAAHGKKARVAFELILTTVQLSICLSFISYIVKSSKTITDQAMGVDSDPWIYAVVVILIMTPLSWVRNVADFSSAFFLANVGIIWALIVVIYYCVPNVIEQRKFGPNIVAVNESSYLTTLGFAIHMYQKNCLKKLFCKNQTLSDFS